MTRENIIKAAFKVWGRDLYRTTSLTQIALELGVSKTALYRYFKDKDALLDAMYGSFFDDCAGFIKSGFEKAIHAENSREIYLIWIRTMAEYYVRNKDALIFSLIKVYNSRDKKNLSKEFISRGIDFGHPAFLKRQVDLYPSRMQLSMATLIFCIAQFHNHNNESKIPDYVCTEDEVRGILSEIEERITKGMGLNAGRVASLNYQVLEEQATNATHEDTEDSVLLRAVAEAVAEVGPWEASMEMVAKHSGLSKSGLYAHFKNKQDMLNQLFITEFTRIMIFAKEQIETTEVHEEQLYLAIISIVNYLRSRPEILVAINWIKTGRLDFGKNFHDRFDYIIGEIKLAAIQQYDRPMLIWAAQWILFMIVNTLALWSAKDGVDCTGQDKIWGKNAAEVPNEIFRTLFRFIALGLDGFNF